MGNGQEPSEHTAQDERSTGPNNDGENNDAIPIRTAQLPAHVNGQPGKAIKSALLNVNSIISNDRTTALRNIIETLEIDIMLITETKLNFATSLHLKNCTPPKFKYFHIPRTDSDRAGGVGVILRDNFLPALKRPENELKINSFEYIIVEININGRKMHLINIYRPPSKSIKCFLSDFSLLMQYINAFNIKCIITGDFNIRVNDTTKKSSGQFLQLLNDLSLQNCVKVPTYGSGNTLDLVIDNYVSPLVQDITVSKDYSFSDHYMVRFEINIKFVPNKSKKLIEFRKYSESNIASFFQFLETELRKALCQISDPSEFMVILNNLIDEGNDLFFPLQSKTITERPEADWYDTDCRIAKTECRKVERLVEKVEKLKRKGYPINDNDIADLKSAWRCVISSFNKLISAKKKSYYIDKFQAYLRDPRATFGIVAHLLGKRGEKILPAWAKSDPAKFVNEFNNYLQNKIANIRDDIKSINSDIFSEFGINVPTGHGLETLQPIDENDILNYIAKCKLTNCPNDKINFNKIELHSFKDIMRELINICFASGKFPESEKEGIIYPRLKSNDMDADSFASYRPVTNITVLSKIIEIAINNRLNEYLMSCNLIPEFQSAFRANHSTETALLKVHSDIIRSLDNSKTVCMICLDLSAAFDTVDHEILINELRACGVEGTALKLFESYLENRTVRVAANGTLSEPLNLKYGIPQGSVLAPTLFSVYTRTLAYLLESMGVSYHIYADDTQIYFEFDPLNIDDMKEKIRLIFEKVDTWMSAYKLKLNVNKTKVIIFGPKKTVHKTRKEFGKIKIGETELPLSESVKNLGVIFDQDLNFEAQLSAVIKSCNYSLYNLKSVKPFLPQKLFISVIHQEVIAKLDYCNSLYLQLPKKQLQRLQLVINRCVRLIFGLPKRAHITSHLKSKLHWLPIAARIDFKIILLTYKALNSEQPKYLRESLSVVLF